MNSDHFEPVVSMKKSGATIPRIDREDSSSSRNSSSRSSSSSSSSFSCSSSSRSSSGDCYRPIACVTREDYYIRASDSLTYNYTLVYTSTSK